jgi:pyrroline-5-carboxylate reductase
MLKDKKLAVLGVGKLGEALISGLLKNSELTAGDISGSVGHEPSVNRVAEKLNIQVGLDNRKAIFGADIILLAVKPQNMDGVLRQIAIQDRLDKNIPVVRAMPNTPSVYNVGMAGICGGKYATPEHMKLTEAIFNCVGKSVFVDESLMDGVTALSASGPAYVYVVIESLAEAGVKLGISRETSTLLAAQTMLGAATMVLESKAHPALLKDMVTTPAGCTIDGLMELEEGKLRVTLIKAVVKAAERARELVHTQNTSK